MLPPQKKPHLVQFRFLGSEWRYVIMSTVRSCPCSEIDRRPTKSWQKKYLGFVTDPNQVNVGITRAQEGLCIIGGSLGSARGGAGRLGKRVEIPASTTAGLALAEGNVPASHPGEKR